MKSELEYKLDKIADIWNHFIWEYDFCKQKIEFSKEVKTNYFGEILGYFQDTFEIIFDNNNSKTNSEKFSKQISILQSIYIQQDFVEEMLFIFKCGVSKNHLKKDINYSINREIRNELIGHPIRKYKGQFISSCLFGYDGGEFEKVVYLRYHKDNNYEFELMEFPISEIIERHKVFLNLYFDKILFKLQSILNNFAKKIENLEMLIDKKSFSEILEISKIFYESIFNYDFIYDKDSLLVIYSRKDENRRYQNLIDKFYYDLKSSLSEKKKYVKELFDPRVIINSNFPLEPLVIEFKVYNENDERQKNPKPQTFHHELGKIATKRNLMDFDFYSGILKSKCSKNQLIINELEHMKNNFFNDVEYYTAFRLICKEIKELM